MTEDAQARRDSRYVDPNRTHKFVRNDLTDKCYRCDDRYTASIHDGIWRRGVRWSR